MKKYNLENRMVVKLRNSKKYMVAGDILISNDGCIDMEYYDENLLSVQSRECDIIAIYNPIYSLNQLTSSMINPIWERYPRMTKKTLKEGMVVELYYGDRFLVVDNTLIGFDTYISLDIYNNDLSHKEDGCYDVVKVFSKPYSFNCIYDDSAYIKDCVIWKRE